MVASMIESTTQVESTDVYRAGQVGRISSAQASASEKYRPVIATATEVVEW